MKFFKKVIIISTLLGIIMGLSIFEFYQTTDKKRNVINPQKEQVVKPSLIELYREDLQKDLFNNYPDVSSRVKNNILNTVFEESEKYNINPLILYSICYVESTFRHWKEHNTINIIKDNKKVKIRAVGTTGVVWEWWGDSLRKVNIAETRGDLFNPQISIRAGAFVFNELRKREMHKLAKTKDESALLRYFGGSYISYVQKIDAKIASLVRPKLYRNNIQEEVK